MLRPVLPCGVLGVVFVMELLGSVPTGPAQGTVRKKSPAATVVAPLAAAARARLQAAGRPAVAKKATGAKANPTPAQTARHVREQLNRQINIEFPPGTTLRDAADVLHDGHGLTILIDVQAFKDIPDNPIDVETATVQLPKLVRLRLRTVLRMLLAPVGGDFQVRDGVVVIMPHSLVSSGQVLQQPVDAAFDKMPFREALEELAALSGVSIVLDNRATEQAEMPVTATLDSVPLEAAVRMLADMANMKPVCFPNALYVTTPANAELLQEQEKQKDKEQLKPERNPYRQAQAQTPAQ